MTEKEITDSKKQPQDEMIIGMSPMAFLAGLFIVIAGMAIDPSEFSGEFSSVARALLDASWTGWMAIFISGITMLFGGLPRWKTIAAASVIGLVGVASLLVVAASGVDFMLFLGILFFVLIPAGTALFNRFSRT
jgi:hypothetical protein